MNRIKKALKRGRLHMNGIIDRFEGEYAILELENGNKVEVARRLLPAKAKEGDVIRQTPKGIMLDEDETQKRKDRIEKLSQDLWL